MANPNLVSATDIKGANSFVRLDDTNNTQVISNAASSGKAFLVSSIRASNVDGTNACDIELSIYASADGSGTATKLGHTIAVPADASLLLVTKDDDVMLKEGQSIYAKASAAGDLHVTAFWKELA